MKKSSLNNRSKYLKIVVIVFLCFMFSYCHKTGLENTESNYVQDELFFKRTTSSESDIQNGSQYFLRTEFENIKINKAILYFKNYDKKYQIVNQIKDRFGKPLWNVSMILKNDNGYSTIVTPIVSNSNQVTALIFSYENNTEEILIKITDRNKKQEKLKEHGNKEATQFTKASLIGIFNNFNKLVNLIEQQSIKRVDGVIKSNNASIITWMCWDYIWSYTDASSGVVVGVTLPQCSVSISIGLSDLRSVDDGGTNTVPIPTSSGSTGITIQPVLYSVNNSFSRPCLTAVANMIGNAKFIDTLTNIFRNTFVSTGSSSNLIFRENTFQGIAQSYYDPNNSNTWIVELNSLSFQGSSQEFIASVIAHEIEHYFISQYFNQYGMSWSTNFIQHEYMFKNWVNASRDMLLNMFPTTLSTQDATALALGGMDDVIKFVLGPAPISGQVDSFNSYYDSFAQNNYGISLATAQGIRTLYSDPNPSTGYSVSGTRGC